MNKPLRVLVADDDKAICRWLTAVLTKEGYECHTAKSIEQAEPLLREGPLDLALVDIYMGQDNGLAFLAKMKTLQPECKCVVMTAHPSVETVARSVAGGALEYLSKPLMIDELLALVQRLTRPRQTVAGAPKNTFTPESTIIGRSPRMLEVYRAVARVAPSTAGVLITGASGSGKELVARAIHAHSPRRDMPFTPINCGSFPETILESELFGHEKGAFTGADSARSGLFEATNGGTIFLDEISETGLSFQVKLLRVLQEQKVRRVGSNTFSPIDVRIVSATNKDLSALIRAGQFREDLYYRLSVVAIQLPSLEQRREDIPLLIHHFLKRFNQRNRRQVNISEDAVRLLSWMSWPGNVRELENLIERLAIFAATDEISAAEVEHEQARHNEPLSSTGNLVESLPDKVQEMERQEILRALRESGGNKSLAARKLRIGRKTLYEKACRLGIDLQVKET